MATKPKVKKATKADDDAFASGRYELSVKMNGSEYASKTDDIAASMLSFSEMFKPLQIKTKVIVSVTLGDKSSEFVLMNQRAKRVFRNDLAAGFFAKQVSLALNG